MYIKHTKKIDFRFFSQIFLSKSLICSFIISNLSKSFTVAHLSRAPWAIRSWSLICLERPERFTHSRSFVLSDLSESLTFAHLIWAKWVNEQMSDARISKFPALQNSFQFQILIWEQRTEKFDLKIDRLYFDQIKTGFLSW